MNKLENIVGVAIGSRHDVSSGDVSLNAVVMAGENENGEHVFFRGFDICLSTNTITLSETGTLVERMEELALMRALMQTGTLSIDGSGFARGCKLSGGDLDALESRLQSLEIIKRVVDALQLQARARHQCVDHSGFKKHRDNLQGIGSDAPLHYKDRQNGFGYINLGNHPIKLVFYQVSEDMYRMVDGLRLDSLTRSRCSSGARGDAHRSRRASVRPNDAGLYEACQYRCRGVCRYVEAVSSHRS